MGIHTITSYAQLSNLQLETLISKSKNNRGYKEKKPKPIAFKRTPKRSTESTSCQKSEGEKPPNEHEDERYGERE